MVLEEDSLNAHALHNKGISYERLGMFREAIDCFSTVIQKDEFNANAYFNRGCCFDQVGELDLAIKDYSKALDLDKKSGARQTQDLEPV